MILFRPSIRRVSAFVLGLVGLGGLGTIAQAQDARGREQVAALHLELSSVHFPDELTAWQATWTAATAGNVRRLGVAFTDLRRHELGERGALFRAWEGFSRLVTLEPRWPWARLGLAEAALAAYAARADIPSEYDGGIGGTHYEGFVLQVRRILELEPDFEPARVLATRVAVESGDRDQNKAVTRVLKRADRDGVTDPAMQVALGRGARLDHRYVVALQHFEQSARWGGDKAEAQLEIARTLAGLGRLADAAHAWSLGISTPSPRRRDVYRADLEWTAAREELARLDALPDDSLPGFADAFWSRRDASDLRAAGSRLEEHLRRWAYVHDHFRVPVPGRRTQFRRVFRPNFNPCIPDGPQTLDDLGASEPARTEGARSVERVLDHRALMYMRHGAPFKEVGGFQPRDVVDQPRARDGIRVRFQDVGTQELYAGWVYSINGKRRAFYFKPDGALGLDAPRAMVLNTPPNLDMLLRLQDDMPGYAKLAGLAQVALLKFEWSTSMAMPGACMLPFQHVLQDMRDGVEEAMQSDSYFRHMRKPLDAFVQAYAVGRPGDARTLVAFAVPAEQLRVDTTATDRSGMSFTIKVDAAVLDSAGVVSRGDTSITYVVSPVARRGRFLSGLLQLPMQRPGREVRAAIAQDDDQRGVVVALPLEEPAPGALAMSDIIIGRDSSLTTWQAGGRSVAVTPFGVFDPGEAITLYYEVYGLEARRRYRSRVTLRQVEDDRVASSYRSRMTFPQPSMPSTGGSSSRTCERASTCSRWRSNRPREDRR